MSQSPSPASFSSPVAALVQGASRGIGLAFVRQLLEQRDAGVVIATCRNPQGAGVLSTLAEAHPGRLQVYPLDLLEEASIASAAKAVRARVEHLGLLINCAGVLHEPGRLRPERRVADVDADAFVHSVRVNTLGPLLVAKHFQGLFPASKRAVYASLSARVGSIGDNRLGGWYAYRASKAAQNMVTRNLAIELRRRARGIICVSLHPGTVDTGLSKPFQRGVPGHKLFTPEKAAAKLLSVIDSLDGEGNGKFYAWDGSEIPW